jgi:hypothetical protein
MISATWKHASLFVLAVILLSSIAAAQQQPPQTRRPTNPNPPVNPSLVPRGSDSAQAPPSAWPRMRQSQGGQARYGGRQATTVYRAMRPIGPPDTFRRAGWYLGIQGTRAPRGEMVDGVIANSPAYRVGLESGDYVLDAGGYVVGPYQGVYYPLSDALNYGSDQDGWVELLIWNRRTGAEETAWVQLQRR